MSHGRLHIVALEKALKQNSAFLKSIATCKSNQNRRKLIQKASNREISVLQKLLSAFIFGDIGVSKHFQNKIKQKRRQHRILVKKFTKIKRDKQELKNNLLKISPILPLFIKFITAKKSAKKKKHD